MSSSFKEEARDASSLGNQIFLTGELLYLLTHSPAHLGYTVADITRFFLAPIRLNQFRIYRTEQRPVGFTVWAQLSPEISALYATGDHELRPDDWRSGPDLWFAEFIAPFGHAPRIVEELRGGLFADASARFIRRRDGQTRVLEMFGQRHPRAARESSPPSVEPIIAAAAPAQLLKEL